LEVEYIDWGVDDCVVSIGAGHLGYEIDYNLSNLGSRAAVLIHSISVKVSLAAQNLLDCDPRVANLIGVPDIPYPIHGEVLDAYLFQSISEVQAITDE
jgi:hypothetical protein